MELVRGRLGEAKRLCTVVEQVDEAFCCGQAGERIFSVSPDDGSMSCSR